MTQTGILKNSINIVWKAVFVLVKFKAYIVVRIELNTNMTSMVKIKRERR